MYRKKIEFSLISLEGEKRKKEKEKNPISFFILVLYKLDRN